MCKPVSRVLKDSAFTLTSEVAKESKWEAKQIKDRQARLGKLAVETWPISQQRHEIRSVPTPQTAIAGF
jgi:hypothetical protein